MPNVILISFPRLGIVRFANSGDTLNYCDIPRRKAAFIWKTVKTVW